ncbi:MAG: AAA family ATPase [Alphaproteobacteria bacterium]|nr:AAA family ATPase [Alphaproteobacteria bacterium]
MTDRFFPVAPHTLDDAGVEVGLTEQLLIKALYSLNGATSSRLSQRLCLPATPLREILADLKNRNLVVHRSAAMMTGDFRYDLSEAGRREAESLVRRSAWSAAAPVPMQQWIDSVAKQSVRSEKVTLPRLKEVMAGIELEPEVLKRLGMALCTGQALFLHGAPGNGKTTVADRLTAAFPSPVFVPRVLEVEGNLIRLFDPMLHQPVPEADIPTGPGRLDPRWVCCRRPTVIAGGELRFDMLELKYNRELGVSEAPLQLKAAGGTLVIDDFGRQLVSPRDLLNRWIVPLERRVDFLALPDGTKLEVPFDPFVVFSTNLDPSSLVDEAFLRRIPYKVELPDPTEEAFRRLLRMQADRLGLQADDATFDHLIAKHYPTRAMRACHPRDLLTQIRDRSTFLEEPPVVTNAALDEVVHNYFVDLGLS